MEIIHNQNTSRTFSLSTVRGGKRISDTLQDAEKELLHQLADTFTIVYGGQFKRRRISA